MPGSSRVPRAAMVGDPFFPAIIAAYGAIKKGVQIVKSLKKPQVSAMAAPPPMSAMVQNPGLYIPPAPRAGSGTGHRAQGQTTGYITSSSRSLGLPAGSRIQSFPAGVGATRRRYRRMNVLNLRALKRAIRRAKGFEHIARQVLTIPHHFKKHIRARKR